MTLQQMKSWTESNFKQAFADIGLNKTLQEHSEQPFLDSEEALKVERDAGQGEGIICWAFNNVLQYTFKKQCARMLENVDDEKAHLARHLTPKCYQEILDKHGSTDWTDNVAQGTFSSRKAT